MSRSLLQRLAFWQPALPEAESNLIKYAKWKIGDTLRINKVNRAHASFYHVTGKVVEIRELDGVVYYHIAVDTASDAQYLPMTVGVVESGAERVS